MDFEKDYIDEKESLDENIEDLNEDKLFDEKELEFEPEKEEPEEQSKGSTKSANDPEPVYFEKFDDALVSDGQGGYTNLGEAVYAKDSGGRTEINELRNLVDNTDGAVHYKGTTTTALTDGSTTNPITILIEDEPVTYTAVMGDIVVYGSSEFIFDSNAWKEIGRGVDTTPTSGSANFVTSDGIYKNTVGQKYYYYNTLKGEIFNNYTYNKASGEYSHAEGDNTTASGMYSHAEGGNTTASGMCSHTEGYYNTANGPYSHVEGGGNTITANGQYSHVEGANNKASNASCHAEGTKTIASGRYSHAGGYYTNATQEAMTAIGKYNSPRTGDLFNIGNGTSDNNRSNIVEVNSTSLNVNGDIQRDGVGIDDYTTTERKIGKWIDGSDLYQRTFEVTGLSKNTWNNSILDTSGIKIVDFTGLIYWLENQAATDTTPLNYYASGSDNCFTCMNAAQTDMRIYPVNTSSDMSIDKAIITIKYTKSSAQANLMQSETRNDPIIEEEPTEDDMR